MNIKVNDLLKKLLPRIEAILTDQFVGMYVGGSIANENFDPDTSDIDCYIITKSTLSENIIHEIEEMHKDFYTINDFYAKKIETSYVPQNDLLHFDQNNTRPYFNEGNFYLARYGSNFLIELHILRENGINIVGQDIKSFIQYISPDDLKMAIQSNLHEYWEPMLQDTEKLSRSDYQIFAIFTMCRTLYSLETSKITSKISAAHWVIKNENKWKNLIELAIAWKPNQEFNQFENTQKFIRYVIRKSDE